jgi:nucleotide-binding universal stress UspA family protein
MNESSTNSAPAVSPHTILVPVDFSTPGREALAYAVAFAARCEAKLLVLHVVEIPYVGSGLGEIELPPVEADIREPVAENLARMVNEIVAGRVPVETLTRTGQPWFEITEAARELRADLVIVGTHGYTGLKHVLMGSTAERVVRHAPCPVLVVRNRGQ